MKLAIIGSRNIQIDDLSPYIPSDCDEIISGGARGVDTCAAEYARNHGLKLTEFLPEYDKYGRAAPIVRNRAIVEASDEVLAFWDGSSRGTKSVIDFCQKTAKPCRVVTLQK